MLAEHLKSEYRRRTSRLHDCRRYKYNSPSSSSLYPRGSFINHHRLFFNLVRERTWDVPVAGHLAGAEYQQVEGDVGGQGVPGPDLHLVLVYRAVEDQHQIVVGVGLVISATPRPEQVDPLWRYRVNKQTDNLP